MCGSANVGKSFLANRYLGRMKGFKTRGLLGQGTRGIYIWNQVVPLGNEVDGLILKFYSNAYHRNPRLPRPLD